MSYIDTNSKMAVFDISSHILKSFGKEVPIIVCVGSDKILSDMVGTFVADILKERNIPAVVFGGNNRVITKNDAKYLSKYFDVSRLLFVDSGLLKSDNKIAISPYFLLNDGTKIGATSIVAGTIGFENDKLRLAEVSYHTIKKYANIIADSVCDYIFYVELLNSHRQS